MVTVQYGKKSMVYNFVPPQKGGVVKLVDAEGEDYATSACRRGVIRCVDFRGGNGMSKGRVDFRGGNENGQDSELKTMKMGKILN